VDRNLAQWQGDAPFRVVGGRRRKVGIPYIVPWDLEEHNRLDFQHFIKSSARIPLPSGMGRKRRLLSVLQSHSHAE
jgi:hypothetical protein